MAVPHVLVVGAGILGASIAWHLVRSGTRVTVVDAAAPGGVATRSSLAWINASWGNPEPYYRLRVLAMAEWRRLAAALPALPLTWCGGLLWDLSDDRLTAFAAGHARRGYDIRLVDAEESARIEPALASPPARAVHAPGEGAVEPLAATEMLLADVRARGAIVIGASPVRALVARGGRVVGARTDDRFLAADVVVLAAGAGVPALAATVGVDIPVEDVPALSLVTRASRPILRGLVMAPALHMRQARDGAIHASASWRGGDPASECASLLADVRSMLRGGADLVLEGGALAPRPIPVRRMPIIGPVEAIGGLHVAAAHSGVTLAPAVGRLVADTVLTGVRDPILAPFAPQAAVADGG